MNKYLRIFFYPDGDGGAGGDDSGVDNGDTDTGAGGGQSSGGTDTGTGTGTGGTGDQGNKKFVSSLPEAYREDPSFKDYDSLESFCKAHKNAQELIGKRQVPNNESSPEEWNSFVEKCRPESVEAYDFDFEQDKEVMGKMDEGQKTYLTGMKKAFFEVGITPKQAKQLQEKHDELMFQVVQSNKKLKDLADTDFEKLAQDSFGDKTDRALEVSKKMIEANVAEPFKAQIDKLSNEQLMIMASVLYNVHTKYISEDSSVPEKKPSDNGGEPAMTVDEYRTQMIEVRSELTAARAKNDQDTIFKLEAKLQEIVNKISALQK